MSSSPVPELESIDSDADVSSASPNARSSSPVNYVSDDKTSGKRQALSLSALALLARHFHFWSTFQHFPFRHLLFWLNTFTFGALFDTFTFGTCTFGSTLSLLEHFSTLSLSALSLSALSLLARHFHFWLDTFTFGALFDTFTFGTCTFGSTLSLLEHFSTLSLFKPQIF